MLGDPGQGLTHRQAPACLRLVVGSLTSRRGKIRPADRNIISIQRYSIITSHIVLKIVLLWTIGFKVCSYISDWIRAYIMQIDWLKNNVADNCQR